ncbi:MAG: hypothetical protein Q8P46_07020 [Hyphomicrobiales bacterium]|nr:hypothetical protein [Hyphomicrobiales bacterium]
MKFAAEKPRPGKHPKSVHFHARTWREAEDYAEAEGYENLAVSIGEIEMEDGFNDLLVRLDDTKATAN